MKHVYQQWTTVKYALFQNLILICVCTLSVYGCKEQKREKTALAEKSEVPSAAASLSPVQNDTLTIDAKAAVLYQPDSIQMQKRMQAVGEEDFRAGADDYIYYMNMSAEYLEKQGLKVLDAMDKKYLRFVFSGKTAQVIKLDTLPELWGIYFFDPMKKPYLADITMIEEEYGNYYK